MKTYTDRYLELIKEAVICIKDYIMHYHDIPLNTKNYDRIYWDGENVMVHRMNANDTVILNQLKSFEILLIADTLITKLNK